MQESTEAMTTDSHKRQRKKDSETNKRSAKQARKGSKTSAPKYNSMSIRQRIPKQSRKVRGKLGLLEDVPLEVILEIFRYLEPGDLLRLARISQELRDILMSKTSESIWYTARGNVEGLPPLPTDLNEPQYAHLLFEPYCHASLCERRCDDVLWNFRMRSCTKCPIKCLPLNDDAFKQDQPSEYRHRAVLPTEYLDKHGNWEIATRYKKEFYALKDEERGAWIDRKEKEYEEIRTHSIKCRRWLNAKLGERTYKLIQLRNERKEAILQRLEQIGWRTEAETMVKDYYRDTFTNHKLVSQPKKLTDHAWSCMEIVLVRMLSDYHAERSVRQRDEALKSRYGLLFNLFLQIESETDLRDPFPAAALVWDTPNDEWLDDSLCKSKLLEYLPSIIREWRPAKIQEVLEILRKSRPSATVSDLHLATSVFACSSCKVKVLHYPQMFYHRCCHQSSQSRNDKSLENYVLSKWYDPPLGLWMSNTLVYNDKGSQDITKIIKACNLDPKTTTAADLHLANPLIECLSCKFYGRHFMRWPYLPIQHMGHHFRVNSFGAEKAQILEKEIPTRNQQVICCSHCHNVVGPEIFSHLKKKHSDVAGMDTLPASGDFLQIREHWYWNPRAVEPSLYRPFLYIA
ncbi:hypothetical protein BDP27DRAFT_1322563 [Rhodocollybia butyracea]|uniref:F-box domain-containing protein n=1 Tax=Rhodocollybia butyracea TaxID=206335 RepID=A0A9P5PY42_9AGAR|nr:hypothetical protein BDP27DRAFT_1322563 [Rhodocollybia butyracea]